MPLLESLTIVTPTFNSSSTVEDTLLSIKPLVALGAQHIVVDSGSSDGTLDIIKRYDSIVLTSPPGNMYEALNIGFSYSDRAWLTYINSDDILYSDYILSIFKQDISRYSLIYGNIDFIDPVGRFLFHRRAPHPRFLRYLMPFYNPFPQQGTLFRRTVFEYNGGFLTRFKYAADYDFFTRSCASDFVFFKFTTFSVAAFRLSPSQLSQSCRPSMAPEGIFIRKQLLSKHHLVIKIFGNFLATIYRICTNIDSIILRSLRGRRLDSGWR